MRPDTNQTTKNSGFILQGYKVINGPKGLGEAITEYALLEEFCECVIGPSIRQVYMHPICDEYKKDLMNATNEDKAIGILREISQNNEHYHIKSPDMVWQGLNLLYPNLEQRLQRIKEFETNWFPGEIVKARKSYTQSRNWLESLKS